MAERRTRASDDGPHQPGAPRPEGPAVAVLTQRLALAPGDLMAPALAVPALVCDVLLDLGGGLLARQDLDRLDAALAAAGPAPGGEEPRPGDAAAALLCWLLADPGVHQDAGLRARWVQEGLVPWFLTLLEWMVSDVAVFRSPRSWVRDDAGREEAARAFCRFGGVLPAGESAAVADDRWRAVSTGYQQEVTRSMGEHLRRREELERALAAKRAQEAAAQYANY